MHVYTRGNATKKVFLVFRAPFQHFSAVCLFCHVELYKCLGRSVEGLRPSLQYPDRVMSGTSVQSPLLRVACIINAETAKRKKLSVVLSIDKFKVYMLL